MKRIIVALIVILSMVFSTTIAFAAANPNVSIASPVSGSTVYSSNLLISVKITNPTTIRVGVFKQMKTVNSTSVAISSGDYDKAAKEGTLSAFSGSSIFQSELFTTTNNLSFYTKKLENVTPGVYKVRVDTLSAEGAVLYSSSQYVIVKDKSEETTDAAVNFDTPQPGAVQFLQNLLKSIFSN